MSARLELLVTAPGPLLWPDRDEGAADGESNDGAAVWRRRDVLPRLHDDTQFHGGGDAACQAYRAANYGLQLSLTASTLTRAHARAAAALDQLAVMLAAAALDPTHPEVAEPGECLVVDVFSLDARFLPQASKRLRDGPPPAWIWLGVRPSQPTGTFDVESFGLRKLGLREVHVPAVEQRHLTRVTDYLNSLLHYAAATGKQLKAGDATSYGWVDVRLIAAEVLSGYPDDEASCVPRFIREVCGETAPAPGVMVACEPSDDSGDAALRYGVGRASRIVEQLVGAARQCGLERAAAVPRANSTAVVCARVSHGSTIAACRVKPDEIQASGWVAVCRQPDHDHSDGDNFEVVPLKQLAATVPRLFAMLAAPPGTSVTVHENGELTVHLPADDAGDAA